MAETNRSLPESDVTPSELNDLYVKTGERIFAGGKAYVEEHTTFDGELVMSDGSKAYIFDDEQPYYRLPAMDGKAVSTLAPKAAAHLLIDGSTTVVVEYAEDCFVRDDEEGGSREGLIYHPATASVRIETRTYDDKDYAGRSYTVTIDRYESGTVEQPHITGLSGRIFDLDMDPRTPFDKAEADLGTFLTQLGDVEYGDKKLERDTNEVAGAVKGQDPISREDLEALNAILELPGSL